MSIVIACPQCQANYRVELAAQTQRVKCARCGLVFDLPAAPPVAAPLATPVAQSKPLSGKTLPQIEREIADLSDTLQWLKTVLSFAVAVTEKDLRLIGDNLTAPIPVAGLAAKIGILKPSIGVRPATDESAYAKAIEIVGHAVGDLDKVKLTLWEQFNHSPRAQQWRRQVKISQIKAAIEKLEQLISELTAEADQLKSQKTLADNRPVSNRPDPQTKVRLEKLQDALLEGRIDRETYESLKADLLSTVASEGTPDHNDVPDEITAAIEQHLNLAESLANSGNFDGALAAANSAMDLCKHHGIPPVGAQVARGMALLGKQDFALAKRAFDVTVHAPRWC